MFETRPHIPNDLQRTLMIEAGFRCVICKETSGLEIDHIEDYAIVKEHTFDNMIVLCPTCHARKQNTSNPRHINKLALKKIKQNILMLNSRYSDLEKRFLENCYKTRNPIFFIDEHMFLFFKYLVDDGLVKSSLFKSGLTISGFTTNKLELSLTEEGKKFVIEIFGAEMMPK